MQLFMKLLLLSLAVLSSLYGQRATYYNDGAASNDAVTLQGWPLLM